MSDTEAFQELELRLALLVKAAPGLASMIEEQARHSAVLKQGVLLLGHTPSIAPAAYCHTLYPPLEQSQLVKSFANGAVLPELLLQIFQAMNGATLFWGALEIWGYVRGKDHFTEPAYNIYQENIDPIDWVAFASSNCGDTAHIHTRTGKIKLLPHDTSGESMYFDSSEDFFKNSKETGYAAYLD